MAEPIEPEGLRPLNAKVNLEIPTNMPTLYAHHITLQDDGSDVVLSFFEIVPPVIPADPAARAETYKRIEETGVATVCVAKLRMAKYRLPGIHKLLGDTIERIEAQIQALGDSNGITESDNIEN